MAHDIAGLETKLRKLHDTVSKLHEAKHVEAFIPVIHGPGWTTLVEFALVQAYVEDLQARATALHQNMQTLVSIAAKIGK
jgi:hypothetical protein